MRRNDEESQIYPLFSIISFTLIFVIGMIFVRSSWMWIFLGIFYVLFFAYGYWKQCLKSFILLVVLTGLSVGITAIFTRDAKDLEAVALRCSMISVAAVPMMKMSYSRLGKMLDTMRAPRSLSLMVMVLFSFVPILFGERHKIEQAYKVRGGNPYVPFAFFRTLIVPFIVRTISVSDTLALSVETRGFDLRTKPQVIYDPVMPTVLDWIFISLVFIISASMITVGVCI